MRQLGCMSADIYCQNLIIGHTQKHHIYTRTERRGNRRGARETERDCVEDGKLLKIELAYIVKTAIGE
jgi:hypothetical protein